MGSIVIDLEHRSIAGGAWSQFRCGQTRTASRKKRCIYLGRNGFAGKLNTSVRHGVHRASSMKGIRFVVVVAVDHAIARCCSRAADCAIEAVVVLMVPPGAFVLPPGRIESTLDVEFGASCVLAHQDRLRRAVNHIRDAIGIFPGRETRIHSEQWQDSWGNFNFRAQGAPQIVLSCRRGISKEGDAPCVDRTAGCIIGRRKILVGKRRAEIECTGNGSVWTGWG